MAGYHITTIGMFSDTLQTAAGCDSVLTLDLTINNSYAASADVPTAHDSLVWQNLPYMESGMYYDTLQTTTGCDSILTLDLTINNSYTAPVDVQTACDSRVRCIRQVEFTTTPYRRQQAVIV